MHRYPMHTVFHIEIRKVINTGETGSHDVPSQAADLSRSYVMTSCYAADWPRNYFGYFGCFIGLSDNSIFGPVVRPARILQISLYYLHHCRWIPLAVAQLVH